MSIKDMPRGETLSREEIKRRLNLQASNPERLVITPLIDPDKQVEDGSIDVRLSTDFVVTKRSKFASLDPLDRGKKEKEEGIDLRILEYQEKMYVKIGNKLILHPHQFALGTTFEYVKIPIDVIAYVLGRSSWGRLGLVIATATVIHPGYMGIITLELTNLGDTPITLYPGTRIAQLTLHRIGMTEEEKQLRFNEVSKLKTKYKASVAPMFSKIHHDEEWEMIRRIAASEEEPEKQKNSNITAST